jgi:methionine-rich copper-binding protein CopC
MVWSAWMRAWPVRGVLISAAAAAVLAATPPASEAHTDLVESRPVAGEVVNGAIDRIRLQFATPVLEEFTDVVVTSDGPASVASPVVSGGVVEARVSGLDATGTYVVAYRTVAVDGHPVTGSFTFKVGLDADPTAAEVNAASGSADARLRDTSTLAATAVGTAIVGVVGVGVLRRRRAVTPRSSS